MGRQVEQNWSYRAMCRSTSTVHVTSWKTSKTYSLFNGWSNQNAQTIRTWGSRQRKACSCSSNCYYPTLRKAGLKNLRTVYQFNWEKWCFLFATQYKCHTNEAAKLLVCFCCSFTLIGFNAWASGRNLSNVEAASSRKDLFIESPPSKPDNDNLYRPLQDSWRTAVWNKKRLP